MSVSYRRLARGSFQLMALLTAALGAACGGGGNSPPPPLSLSLSPARVTATIYQGDAYSFTVNATVTGTVSGNVYVIIKDNGDSIQPAVNIIQQSNTAYTADFATSSSLTVGNHASTIDVRLCSDTACNTLYGGASLPYDFTVAPIPTLSSISPNSAVTGDPGFTLTATGTGFDHSSTVRWNGTDRPTTYVSPTQITAQISSSDVAIGGIDSVIVFTNIDNGKMTAAQNFTVQNPLPSLSSISPQSAIIGGPGFTLTVNGSSFAPNSTVQWNGSTRTTTYVSPTQLTALITSADIANAGTSSVTVSSPAPGGGATAALAFSTLYPAPSLTLLNANTAQAGCATFSMIVVGTNVGTYSTVLWNDTAHATTLIGPGVLQAQITAADIASAQTATVKISNPSPGGGITTAASFTVTNGAAAATSTAPSYLINPQHTNVATTACPVSLPAQPAWTHDFAAEASYALIVNGKVFTSNGLTLYAFDQLSGTIAWGPVTNAGFGPAYDANTIYVVSNGPCCSGGFLNAYDAATGSPVFTGTLAGQYSFTSAATALNGLVYTGGAGSGGTVYAVNGSNGAMVWRASVANGDASTPAVTADGVYTVYPCQTFDYAPSSGAGVWHYNGGCDGGGGATPTVANGVLYSPGVSSSGGILFNAATGALSGSYYADVAPALTAQFGYFVQNGKLSQIRLSDGAIIWTFSGDTNLVTSPVLVNQTLFIGSNGGTLYALDADTGTLLWTNNVGSLSKSQKYPFGYGPSLAVGGGVLVVPTGNSIKTFVISSSH